MITNRLSLLFTGHMVDLPNRPVPRFPPGLVPAVRERIASRVRHHVGTRSVDMVRGFASLARGGDILFHEICRSFGIATVIVLPFSLEEFVATSVEGIDDGDWPDRFLQLWDATAPASRISLGLPPQQAAHAACNDRLLRLAQAFGDVQMIALWNRIGGDGIGGTGHFVDCVKELSGRDVDIIDPRELFESDAERPA